MEINEAEYSVFVSKWSECTTNTEEHDRAIERFDYLITKIDRYYLSNNTLKYSNDWHGMIVTLFSNNLQIQYKSGRRLPSAHA